MSLWRLVTRATFTPGASSSSYRVTVGPTVIPTSRVSTPWAASAASSTRPASSTSRSSTSWAELRASKLSDGSFHDPFAAAGPSGISSCSTTSLFVLAVVVGVLVVERDIELVLGVLLVVLFVLLLLVGVVDHRDRLGGLPGLADVDHRAIADTESLSRER